MLHTLEEITQSALALDPESRGQLADLLLESLPEREPWDDTHFEELEGRRASYLAGTSKAYTVDEALEQARQRIPR